MSGAHDQAKMDAWEIEDDRAALEALAHAVESAERALALDPDRHETRKHMEKLTRQLAVERAKRNVSESSEDSSSARKVPLP